MSAPSVKDRNAGLVRASIRHMVGWDDRVPFGQLTVYLHAANAHFPSCN